MPVARDWKLEVAHKLVAELNPDWEISDEDPMVEHYAAVIAEHLPVPRCNTCRHSMPSGPGYILCSLIRGDDGEKMWFKEDFGCVQWEAK